MLDEDTGAEPRITSASIVDPYLLLIRDDSSVFLAQIDNNNELDEVVKPEGPLKSLKWSSGCLYYDTQGAFQATAGERGPDGAHRIMMFLLSSTGALHVGSPLGTPFTFFFYLAFGIPAFALPPFFFLKLGLESG